jgi:hypothetical protein
VIIAAAVVTFATIVPAFWRHVDLAAEDWLNAEVVGLFIELEGAVHVAVIRQGNCRHAKLYGSFEHVPNTDGTVEKTILTVHVEVNKLF